MTKPAWSDPSANPFALFGTPTAAGAPAQPLAQGLAGGMELFKKFWSNLPGGAAIPGFLVPTLDVGELDKRLSDLRAAQQWLEVNLNVLRATIQGLEVQRNTIAAIQSLSAMRESTPAPATGGLPAGWPMPQSSQSSQSSPAAPPTVAAAAPPPASSPKTPVEPVASPAPTGDGAGSPGDEASGGEAADAPLSAPAIAGFAASNWLGFMQDQFAKVAQAALAPGAFDTGAVASAPPPAPAKAARKAVGKAAVARKAVAKKAARRKPTARKPA